MLCRTPGLQTPHRHHPGLPVLDTPEAATWSPNIQSHRNHPSHPVPDIHHPAVPKPTGTGLSPNAKYPTSTTRSLSARYSTGTTPPPNARLSPRPPPCLPTPAIPQAPSRPPNVRAPHSPSRRGCGPGSRSAAGTRSAARSTDPAPWRSPSPPWRGGPGGPPEARARLWVPAAAAGDVRPARVSSAPRNGGAPHLPRLLRTSGHAHKRARRATTLPARRGCLKPRPSPRPRAPLRAPPLPSAPRSPHGCGKRWRRRLVAFAPAQSRLTTCALLCEGKLIKCSLLSKRKG